MTRYLFATGCPRSGTSALWRLLTSHPEIVMGVERYHGRVGSLDRSMFERERFFRIERGDTFYADLETFEPRYAEMARRWEQAVYRGDKIPMLYKKLPQLEEAFGDDLSVIAIVRNVYDVAASYQRRRDDPSDTEWPDDGPREAVRDWNRALEVLFERRSDPRYHVVVYERLFGHGIADGLFNFLGLEITDSVRAQLARLAAWSAELTRKRVDVLSAEDREYVAAQANQELYLRVWTMADLLAHPARNPRT